MKFHIATKLDGVVDRFGKQGNNRVGKSLTNNTHTFYDLGLKEHELMHDLPDVHDIFLNNCAKSLRLQCVACLDQIEELCMHCENISNVDVICDGFFRLVFDT